MTRKPRPASWEQNSSFQSIIWQPRPMIMSIGGESGSPKLSQTSSMPLA
jgi:hypothetical protein